MICGIKSGIHNNEMGPLFFEKVRNKESEAATHDI